MRAKAEIYWRRVNNNKTQQRTENAKIIYALLLWLSPTISGSFTSRLCFNFYHDLCTQKQKNKTETLYTTKIVRKNSFLFATISCDTLFMDRVCFTFSTSSYKFLPSTVWRQKWVCCNLCVINQFWNTPNGYGFTYEKFRWKNSFCLCGKWYAHSMTFTYTEVYACMSVSFLIFAVLVCA